MDLPAALLSAGIQGVVFALAALGLLALARKLPWRELAGGVQLNLLLGFAVCLTLIWSMKAGVKPGLNLHLLGAMAATLALGPWKAIAALALALCGITLNGALEWGDWPANFVLMVLVPVSVASGLHRLIERLLPAHFFIFIFVTGFAGSALTAIAQGLTASSVLALSGAYSADFLWSDYLPFFLLLGFSEGWISGAIITLMVVYRPEWVSAFDDRRYLLDK